MTRFLILSLVMVMVGSNPSLAQTCDTPSGEPVPRFVSLRYGESVGRAGPSDDHAKVWVYLRRGLPMEVIAETPNWRRVRDPGGEEVWMKKRLLSSRRSFWVRDETVLYSRHDTQASIVAQIEPGAVLSPDRCRPGWCRIEAQGYRGWVPLEGLWGVDGTEVGAPAALEGGNNACYRSVSNPTVERQGQ